MDWIADHVDFPSTMVDRIVPAATAGDRDTASRLIGARDEATVVAEPYRQWVLEDAFRGRRPAWEAAGAMLVPDTGPYEAMKLRLVNGGHSALAYLGLLRGHETVADAVADPELAAFLERLLESELAPTLGPVPGIDLDRYRADLRDAVRQPAHRAPARADRRRRRDQAAAAPARPRARAAGGGARAGADLPRRRGVAALARGAAASRRGALEEEIAAAVGGRGQPGARRPSGRWPSSAVFGDDLREDATFRALLADGLAALA